MEPRPRGRAGEDSPGRAALHTTITYGIIRDAACGSTRTFVT